jgi:hypothetical protein
MLKCMVDAKCGVLESLSGHNLCYFEVDDLNLEGPAKLEDLVAVLNSGLQIRYQVLAFVF